MPDIAMCTGERCHLKETCYRYLAKPDIAQSWFAESPIEKHKCNYYWKYEKNVHTKTTSGTHRGTPARSKK